MSRNTAHDLEADTENEIMAFIFDKDIDDGDPEDFDLEAPEGWDGAPLGEAEVAAVNIFGHDPVNNHDRPIALAEEQSAQAENSQLREYIAQLQQHVGEQAQREDPVRQAQLAEQRERLELAAMSNPREILTYPAQLEQQNQQLQEARVNENLNQWARSHGEDFDQAYSDLISLDKNNPMHRSIVESVWRSPDPGAALMSWHACGGAPAAGVGRRGTSLPSLNSQTPAASRSLALIPFCGSGRHGWPGCSRRLGRSG
jgi:hypothetical protein